MTEKEIHEWWDRKFENYIKKYAIGNELMLMQSKDNVFTEIHEKIIDFIPIEIKIFLEIRIWLNFMITTCGWCKILTTKGEHTFVSGLGRFFMIPMKNNDLRKECPTMTWIKYFMMTFMRASYVQFLFYFSSFLSTKASPISSNLDHPWQIPTLQIGRIRKNIGSPSS